MRKEEKDIYIHILHIHIMISLAMNEVDYKQGS